MTLLKEVHGGRGRSRAPGEKVLWLNANEPHQSSLAQEAHGAWGNRKLLKRGLGKFFFDVRKNHLPFNVTVDLILPSSVFPHFQRSINDSCCYHFPSWQSPSHRITLPCRYSQVTVSWFSCLTGSLISLPSMSLEIIAFWVNTSSFVIHPYYTIISSCHFVSLPVSKSYSTF